jgi:hypothetical protein
MCEGVIVAADPEGEGKPSLTALGRVRVAVVRRSYADGEKPVVDVAPGRLVVLKSSNLAILGDAPYLPLSPLPTQAEKVRAEALERVEMYKERARGVRDGGEAPLWAYEELCEHDDRLHRVEADTVYGMRCPDVTDDAARAQALAWYEKQVVEFKAKAEETGE